MDCSTPRLIISSYKGKSGKTLATIALARSLISKGYKVSIFKVGPDYIDPSYHSVVTGKLSRNLDYILMGDKIIGRFCEHSAGSDIALIEGVAGLYDSPDGESEIGSTAQLSKLLKAPVVIVINGERINRTAGAIIRGLKDYDREVKIVGAIITNVVNGQEEKIKKAVEKEGVEVLGAIKRSEKIEEMMKYRHLGLVHANEIERDKILLLANMASKGLDAERSLKIARESSEPLSFYKQEGKISVKKKVKIAIALSRAFSFYYPETIEYASEAAELSFVDPEKDQEINADVLIIGGGFPEVYAEELERNKPFINSLRKHIDDGKPFYGECGGLIYLTEALYYKGSEYKMSGVFDAYSVFMDKPVGHGYAFAEVIKDNLIAKKGAILKGHEFHHIKIIAKSAENLTIKYVKGSGINGLDGFYVKNAYASFLHLHPETINFLEKILYKFV